MTLRTTDRQLADNSRTVLGGSAGVQLVGGPAVHADVTLTGPASGMLLALLRRRSTEDAGVSVQGDAALWRSWLALTPL